MTEQPFPDELPPYGRSDPTASCRYCPQPVKPEDDPMVWIDHMHWAHAACFERHHTPNPDALAEAEEGLRSSLEQGCAPHVDDVAVLLAEFDRLRLVEQAATALVEHWTEPAWRNALAYERSHAPDGTVPARMVELIGALVAAVHGEMR